MEPPSSRPSRCLRGRQPEKAASLLYIACPHTSAQLCCKRLSAIVCCRGLYHCHQTGRAGSTTELQAACPVSESLCHTKQLRTCSAEFEKSARSWGPQCPYGRDVGTRVLSKAKSSEARWPQIPRCPRATGSHRSIDPTLVHGRPPHDPRLTKSRPQATHLTPPMVAGPWCNNTTFVHSTARAARIRGE